MKFILSLSILIFTMILMACNTSKFNLAKEQPTTIIKYRRAKARCMQCPDFTIEILNNRTAVYSSQANVPVLEERIIPLSGKAYKRILNQFEQSNFRKFEPLYMTRRRDAPRLVLTYKGYKVNTQEKACPPPLMELIQLIESIKPK